MVDFIYKPRYKGLPSFDCRRLQIDRSSRWTTWMIIKRHATSYFFGVEMDGALD